LIVLYFSCLCSLYLCAACFGVIKNNNYTNKYEKPTRQESVVSAIANK